MPGPARRRLGSRRGALAPVMAAPSSSRVTVSGSKSAAQRAAQDHPDRVGQADQLLEVGGDEQHARGPPRRARLMWSQIAAWAPTSTPRVGWAARSTFGSCAHLAADDELLLVAAGERAAGDEDRRRPDVVLLDDPLGLGLGRLGVDEAAGADVGRLGLVAEDDVLPERRLEEHPVAVPVLGDVARPRPRGSPGPRQSEMSTPSRVMLPELGSRMPMITSTSSAWPLPSTPAMPTISPAWMVSEMSSRTRLPPAAPSRLACSMVSTTRSVTGRLLRSAATAARSRPSARPAAGR